MEGENNKINNMIEKLIDKNIDSSLAVCDLNDIVKRYQSWIFAMPKIKPFYAIKSNNYPRIRQLFADLGVGFECGTQYEIEATLETNCPPDKIIYASTIKNTNHISYANSVGVSLTTFDSLSELEKCKKNYENARLMIRIKTYSKNESNFEEKFGCDPYNEAPILLEAAKSLGLNVIGVSFHVGTICDDGPTFCTAIKLARHVFNIADELGFKFDVLDIGGGFIPRTENTIFENREGNFVRSSTRVATRVISVKPNRLNCNENELKYAYYVDNGICNMFQTVSHGFPVSSPLTWKKTTPLYPSTLFGPTAVHCDTICPDVILPRLDVGDWLIFHNMGVYTQCLETIFQFCRPTPVYFIDTSDTLFSKNKTTFCDEFYTVFSMDGENNKINNMIEMLIDENIDSSFAVCDLNDIVRKYRSWTLAMPKIKPFYAVKCNNYPRVLQLLSDLGVGFECATKCEIETVLKTNCSPGNIIYASTIKDINHISYANSVGVTLTTFDSLSELEKCKKSYGNAKLLIRIKTYSKNESNFEDKFGCDPYNEAPILLKAAKALGLNVIGVSFHVGTICNDCCTYYTAIKLARHVFNIADELGLKFDVLDIGGGFIPHTEKTIFEIGKCINNALDTYFPSKDMKFIAEPGRYFVRSSVTIASRVISGKPNRLNCNEKELKYLYFVDNGISNMFQTVALGFPISPPLAWKKATPSYSSTVFGQTMMPCDVICSNVMLPRLKVGDWIIFRNMGAYSQCMETKFHLNRLTPVYFIDFSDE